MKKKSEDYYNSTLVIPMSITSEKVDKNSLFYKKYFQQNNQGKVNSETKIKGKTPEMRAIWGFVCFDTKLKDYFDKSLDLELGYIIADILSIYIIFYYNYAISSKTVLEYEKKYFNDEKNDS